jgi:hypothetical protein
MNYGADQSYDSTEDFWKIILHSDGGIQMIDDGEEDVTIEDWRDGKWGEKSIEEYVSGSRTAFWASVLRKLDVSDMGGAELDQMLQEAGWTWDDDSSKWNGNWTDVVIGADGDKWQGNVWSGLRPLGNDESNTPAWTAKIEETDRKRQENWNRIANFFGFGTQTPNGIEGLNGRIASEVVDLLNSDEKWYNYSEKQLVSYIHSSSCQNVVSWVADKLQLDYVNEIFKETADTEGFETGSRFRDIDKKLEWFENNPDKGLFLGSYVFKQIDGQFQLQQLQATGNSEFDTAPRYGLDNLQEYLDAGHVVLSWTPRNMFLPEDHKDDVGRTLRLDSSGRPALDRSGNETYNYFNSAHIAFVSKANNQNLLTDGPYLSQGGLNDSNWSMVNRNGMHHQRFITNYRPSVRRSFYYFVLFQGVDD